MSNPFGSMFTSDGALLDTLLASLTLHKQRLHQRSLSCTVSLVFELPFKNVGPKLQQAAKCSNNVLQTGAACLQSVQSTRAVL